MVEHYPYASRSQGRRMSHLQPGELEAHLWRVCNRLAKLEVFVKGLDPAGLPSNIRARLHELLEIGVKK